MELTPFVTQALSWLTVMGQVMVLFGLLFLLFFKSFQHLVLRLRPHLLLSSLVVAFMATGGSLFYSEIAGYEPCELCWYQRIFMYPLVLLFAMGWLKKDSLVFSYTLPLTVVGGIIALYHYLLQIGVTTSAPCSAVGYSSACSQVFVMNLGYITIPMMAFTAFAMLIVFSLLFRRTEK